MAADTVVHYAIDAAAFASAVGGGAVGLRKARAVVDGVPREVWYSLSAELLIVLVGTLVLGKLVGVVIGIVVAAGLAAFGVGVVALGRPATRSGELITSAVVMAAGGLTAFVLLLLRAIG